MPGVVVILKRLCICVYVFCLRWLVHIQSVKTVCVAVLILCVHVSVCQPEEAVWVPSALNGCLSTVYLFVPGLPGGGVGGGYLSVVMCEAVCHCVIVVCV